MSDDAKVNEAYALIEIENKILKIEKNYSRFLYYKVFWIVELLIFLSMAVYIVESHGGQYSGGIVIGLCIMMYFFVALPNKLLMLKIYGDVRELATIYKPISDNIQKHLDKER